MDYGYLVTGKTISAKEIRSLSLMNRRTFMNCRFTGDLSFEDISFCAFEGCDFTDVNLSYAKIKNTNFYDCATRGMNVSHALLLFNCFRSVDVSSGRTVFRFYMPEDGIGFPEVPFVFDLEEKIYQKVIAAKKREKRCPLDMREWHICDTVHCLAGWAVHLAGDLGYALESAVGTEAAGSLIYQKSCGYVPDFFMNTDKALADLENRIAGDLKNEKG